MRPDFAPLPPRFLRTKEAAYRKLGDRVFYAVNDLEVWATRGAVTSTFDPRGSVHPGKSQALPAVPKRRRDAR
ncbi:DNA-binding protein (plasmid) [Sinorhizobium kummerowiae]|uniref:DNA-binding protein n=1 Tax=Sinorhizobium kummerowiae TaxID=158892 RepID=A0ABY8THG2_9HYPH|nr:MULTISPECIES: DNA-binding protein [Sinorhizobium]RVN73201.1 DNA-binding protein [Sinorhizobium meliloti]WHS96598.1 DNA-binding protein [Sinorhizobium kummerowiae]WQH41464.1 DNA-binding protein [Sinorhizobium kummerowiae]